MNKELFILIQHSNTVGDDNFGNFRLYSVVNLEHSHIVALCDSSMFDTPLDVMLGLANNYIFRTWIEYQNYVDEVVLTFKFNDIYLTYPQDLGTDTQEYRDRVTKEFEVFNDKLLSINLIL